MGLTFVNYDDYKSEINSTLYLKLTENSIFNSRSDV